MLAEQLTQHLQQSRPSIKADGENKQAQAVERAEAAEQASVRQDLTAQPEPALESVQLRPLPSELQSMYSEAVQKMPALRCAMLCV